MCARLQGAMRGEEEKSSDLDDLARPEGRSF